MLGFAISLIVLLSTIILSYVHSNRIITSTSLIVHTHEVLAELSDIEAKLIDLETGQRGFIITSKLEYLKPYNRSLVVLQKKLDYLKKLTSDNTSQINRIELLEDLINAKLKELNLTIELKQREGFESAKKIVDTDEGKEIMDKIRDQLAEIENEELILLKERSLEPIEARELNDVILIILLVCSLVISIVIALYTSHSITNPIKTLVKSTEIIGQGKLNHKIGIKSKDEIGDLSRSFEAMLIKLRATTASRDVLEQEIEARKRTEKELINAKKRLEKSELLLTEINKTKDKFFSIIAHDLKNSFNVLLGYSKLLDESPEEYTEEERKEFISIINSGAKKTFALLENLLVWARVQRGLIDFKPQPENLYLLLQESIDLTKMAAKAKSIKIKTEIPNNIFISADRYMFDTIVRNLMSNAIKFTPQKGEISIIADLIKDDMGNNFVEIQVKDNGVGIPEENQYKLFDIGEKISTIGTVNEKGTGLGLNICKDFIKLHGGNIWFKSEVEVGSNFYFTLPKAN